MSNKKKNRIDWRRTIKNNGYMLDLIAKSCPGILVMTLITTVLGSIHAFLLNTYLYKYPETRLH